MKHDGKSYLKKKKWKRKSILKGVSKCQKKDTTQEIVNVGEDKGKQKQNK